MNSAGSLDTFLSVSSVPQVLARCTCTSQRAHDAYLRALEETSAYTALRFPPGGDQTAPEYLTSPVHAAAYCGCPKLLEQQLTGYDSGEAKRVLEDAEVPVVVPAARAGRYELLQYLHRNYEVDLHQRRRGGWTPLKYAAGRLEWAAKYGGEWHSLAVDLEQTVVYLLKDAEASGQYPQCSPETNSHRSLVLDVQHAGSKYRESGNAAPGWNLLHAAAHIGGEELARWLLTNQVFGADEADTFGRRPYEVADLAGHQALVRLLAGEAAVAALASYSQQYIQGIMVTAALVATVTFVGFTSAPAGTMPTPFQVDEESFNYTALMAFFWLNGCSFYLAESTIIACTFSLFPSYTTRRMPRRAPAQLLMGLLLSSVALFVAAFGAAGFVVLHQSGVAQGQGQAIAMVCFGTLVCIVPAIMVASTRPYLFKATEKGRYYSEMRQASLT